MPKKTIAEFKAAFIAIKKPSRPRKVTRKMKGALETAVGDEDSDDFVDKIGALAKLDRGYLVDLVAYKISKHMETADKLPFWKDKVPPDVLSDAMAKIVPNDMDSPTTQKAMDRAVADGDKTRTALLFARDPAKASGVFQAKLLALGGKGDRETRRELSDLVSANVSGGGMAFRKDTLIKALKQGNKEAATDLGSYLGFFSDDELVDIARQTGAAFFADALTGLKDSEGPFIQRMGNRKLRDDLAAVDPGAWDAFVDKTPMLAAVREVETKIADADPALTQDEILASMFEAAMDPANMPLTYVATKFTPNTVLLMGESERGAEAMQVLRDNKVAQARKEWAEGGKVGPEPGPEILPDMPATDCHNTLNLMQELLKLCPGPKPKIVPGSCADMLMTKPPSSFPGKGTLDRGFAGNVFDDGGTATGRILFTGDNGKNSHSWIVVDDVPFDPVMGTKGKQEVEVDPVEMVMTWVIPKRLAKGPGGYAVMDTALKVASNKMGFSTGYYLTADPRPRLTADEREKAGL